MSDKPDMPWHEKNISRVLGIIALGVMGLIAADQLGWIERMADENIKRYDQQRINDDFLSLKRELEENDTVSKSNNAYSFSVEWEESGMLPVDKAQNTSIVNIHDVVVPLHKQVIDICEDRLREGKIDTCEDLSIKLKILVSNPEDGK